MTSTNRSYSAGSFELAIDGHPTNAYIKSVDGGQPKANVTDEPVGASHQRVRHLSTVDIEPFSLEIGMSGAEPILKWIQQSWKRDFNRRSGVVTHADFNLQKQFEHEFREALITEVTFPALDGSSKDPAYLKLKFQPEVATFRKVDSQHKVSGKTPAKQKLWLSNAFRLTIDGIDGLQYANRIEEFTIKQAVTKAYTGRDRFPQIEPTKLEFPSLSGSLAMQYADGVLDWFQRYVVRGEADPKAQKTGALEFLHPDRQAVIFRLNLFEVGISALSVPQQAANSPEIKRMKFTLYVGRMELDSGNQRGFGEN